MNKKGYRRIIGLCIFALATMLLGIIDVNADESACDKVDNGKILEHYGLEVDYDEIENIYKIKSNFNSEVGDMYDGLDVKTVKFKISKLYFYEPYSTEVDENNKPINKEISDADIIKDVDSKGNDSTYKGYVQKYSGSMDDLVTAGVLKTLSLGANDTIKVDPKIFNYNSDKTNKIGIAFKIVPDGFQDPEVKKECGAKATFFAIVHVAYETWEEEQPEELPSDIDDSSNYVSKWLDCTNYQSFNKDSFDYKFCADRDAAVDKDGNPRSSITKSYDITKDKNGIIIKYDKSDKQKKHPYKPEDSFGYKCDYNVNPNTGTNSTTNSGYYTNINYLYGDGTFTIKAGNYVYSGEYKGDTKTTVASCKIHCEEVVKVEYGPPVASKAGLCFEYKVKVTSRVNCEGEAATKPPKQVSCTPTPHCKHSNGKVWHVAGPNDDFDECVQSCDGGIYSDRCVNKCYKKVYGNSIVRQTTGYEIAYDGDSNDSDAAYLKKKAYQFKKDDNGIYWDTGSKGTERKRSNYKGGTAQSWEYVKDADSYWHKHHSWGSSSSTYNKYTEKGMPEKLGCDDIKCWWSTNKSNACKTTTNLRYLNHPNVYKKEYNKSHGGKEYTYYRADKEDLTKYSAYYKDKIENKKIYDNLVKQCNAYASCNTTTSEFTISVDYTEKGEGKTKQTIYYPYTENNDKNAKDTIKNNDTSVSCPTDTKNTIILSSAGCYNCSSNGIDTGDTEKDAAGKVKMYMTEWSFPGTWINNKTGMISYKPNKSVSWKKIKNKFCLPLNVANANPSWYNYYQEQTKGNSENAENYSYYNLDYIENVKCPDGMTLATKCNNGNVNNIDYNIRAATRKFGLYEWNIDIECFYATNDLFPKVDKADKCELTCTNDSTEKYRIRSVDLNNLFPATSGENETRSPGFNWTSFASQTSKDTSYTSSPSNYAKWIQYTAQNGGVYKDEYLDYEVTLTKDIINEIKKDFKLNKTYTSWEGDIVNTDNESSANSYRSPLFKNGGLLSSGSVYPNGTALKCNNIGTHTVTSDYAAECAEYSNYEEEGK